MTKLSVIILSYNTSSITQRCLDELLNSLKKTTFNSEIILVDNASKDGSQKMISEFIKKFSGNKIKIESILNEKNAGFPKGNNQGVKIAHGEFILFLNSDVMVGDINWENIIAYISKDQKIGALTIRLNLPSGNIDPASHRGFPTVWNSFCYYLGLEKLTGHIPVLNQYFGGYHLINLDLSKIHQIDSPSGAFFLIRKNILDTLGSFDETYFMYGEDLDLAYKINSHKYKIMYFPLEKATHLKYSSGLKNKDSQKITKQYFYDAMKIFYKKHYEEENPRIVNSLVYLFIGLRSKL